MRKILNNEKLTKHQEIFKKFNAGASLVDLSDEYRLSKERIRQIVAQQEREDKKRRVSILYENYVDIKQKTVRFNMKEITYEEYLKLLIEFGATPQQTTTKIVDICWDWLSQINPEEIVFKKHLEETVARSETEIDKNKRENKWLESQIETKRTILGNLEKDISEKFEILNELSNRGLTPENILSIKTIDKQKEELEQRFTEIMAMETAEGRDKLRMAKLYSNNVAINTKYDNTAYIAGLGAIMSGSNNVLCELERINPKIKG